MQFEQLKMEQTERIEMNKIEAKLMEVEMIINGKLQEAQMKGLEGGEQDKLIIDLKKHRDNLELKRDEMKQKSELFYAGLKSKEGQTRLQLQSSEKIANKRVPAKT